MNLVKLAVQSYNKSDYRFEADLLNKIVAYSVSNKDINYLLVGTLEQLGYQ
ncbi:TPA: alkyl sulfatase dimerization domain-containing protein [Providencia alcalifaciens]